MLWRAGVHFRVSGVLTLSQIFMRRHSKANAPHGPMAQALKDALGSPDLAILPTSEQDVDITYSDLKGKGPGDAPAAGQQTRTTVLRYNPGIDYDFLKDPKANTRGLRLGTMTVGQRDREYRLAMHQARESGNEPKLRGRLMIEGHKEDPHRTTGSRSGAQTARARSSMAGHHPSRAMHASLKPFAQTFTPTIVTEPPKEPSPRARAATSMSHRVRRGMSITNRVAAQEPKQAKFFPENDMRQGSKKAEIMETYRGYALAYLNEITNEVRRLMKNTPRPRGVEQNHKGRAVYFEACEKFMGQFLTETKRMGQLVANYSSQTVNDGQFMEEFEPFGDLVNLLTHSMERYTNPHSTRSEIPVEFTAHREARNDADLADAGSPEGETGKPAYGMLEEAAKRRDEVYNLRREIEEMRGMMDDMTSNLIKQEDHRELLEAAVRDRDNYINELRAHIEVISQPKPPRMNVTSGPVAMGTARGGSSGKLSPRTAAVMAELLREVTVVKRKAMLSRFRFIASQLRMVYYHNLFDIADSRGVKLLEAMGYSKKYVQSKVWAEYQIFEKIQSVRCGMLEKGLQASSVLFFEGSLESIMDPSKQIETTRSDAKSFIVDYLEYARTVLSHNTTRKALQQDSLRKKSAISIPSVKPQPITRFDNTIIGAPPAMPSFVPITTATRGHTIPIKQDGLQGRPRESASTPRGRMKTPAPIPTKEFESVREMKTRFGKQLGKYSAQGFKPASYERWVEKGKNGEPLSPSLRGWGNSKEPHAASIGEKFIFVDPLAEELNQNTPASPSRLDRDKASVRAEQATEEGQGLFQGAGAVHLSPPHMNAVTEEGSVASLEGFDHLPREDHAAGEKSPELVVDTQ